MSINWYELEYEDDENGESYCGPKVLYTSEQGLLALNSELQRICGAGPGRHKLEIKGMDQERCAPFTHVEIADEPPEKEENNNWSWKPFIWVVAVVVTLLFLALYGLVRLVMDVVV